MKDFEYYNTLLVQAVGAKSGPVAPAIVPSAAFAYTDAEQAEAIFSGELNSPLYARMGHPTNAKLEAIVAEMEGGFGAIATASGMGAISMVTTALLKAGDEILCVGGFFGGTYTLVTETLHRFGVRHSFCEVDDLSFVESKLRLGVAMVLMESVGNPSLRLPDLRVISEMCEVYETLLVVDNTATPLTVRPLEMGADIVVHSSPRQ